MQKISTTSSSIKTYEMIITSMLIALVFVATMLLNFKLPISANGGLVHLGTGMLFIAAILFGPKKGAAAGAIGMGLFDLVAGFTLWAPITFLTRGLQGYIIGKIAWSNDRKGSHLGINLFAIIISTPPMLAGYYIGEAIIFKSWIIPATSIPGDLLQTVIGILVAIPACLTLRKLPYFR